MELSINSGHLRSFMSINLYTYVFYPYVFWKSGSSLMGLWLNADVRFLIRRWEKDGGTQWRSNWSFFLCRVSEVKSPTGVGEIVRSIINQRNCRKFK